MLLFYNEYLRDFFHPNIKLDILYNILGRIFLKTSLIFYVMEEYS